MQLPGGGEIAASALTLDADERAMLAGEQGEARRLAMNVLVRFASIVGATRFVRITGAHIDSCLYHGQASLDFAERLTSLGAKVQVPTTLNVGAVDLLHPDLFRGDAGVAARGRRLMELYVEMGADPTFTCAPYQLPRRPGFGEHVAWAESNAIVFANSVLGARTHRYGDFIDILAAIAGRVPLAGLHLPENRRGTVRYVVHSLPDALLDEDALYPVLGHFVGETAGGGVPVIEGLPAHLDEHRLKALAAASASSGSVAILHVVGTTPEAATADAAFGEATPDRTIVVDLDVLRGARDRLTTRGTGPLVGVSLGTPHFSIDEFARLVPLLRDAPRAAVDFYVSTARSILDELDRRRWTDTLRAAGVTIVVDTCTYITPILKRTDGVVMTNSAKWAYYAPANLGVDVAFGSLAECVRSASAGRIMRDNALWGARRAGQGQDSVWAAEDARGLDASASHAQSAQASSAQSAESSRAQTAESSDAQSAEAPRTHAAEASGGRTAEAPVDQIAGAPAREPRLTVRIRPLVAGSAAARALVLDEPISFWGGIDAATGRIIEARHPQHGATVTGRVLVLPGARGSSSSASVIAEMIRARTAPAAIVMRETDSILAIGALVGELLYGGSVPISLFADDAAARIETNEPVFVEADRIVCG